MNKYGNLGKDELIRLLLQKDNQLVEKDNQLIEKDNQLVEKNNEINRKDCKIKNIQIELEKTIIELRDTREKLDKLILKYENSHQRQLRDTYNKFVKTSEKLETVDEAINEAETKAKRKTGQKKGNHNFTYELKPTRKIIKELPENERICQKCGEVMIEIGEDSTKKIIKYPATYEVVEIITKKYACKNHNCDSSIKQAISNEVFGHSPVTPSLVADVINMKYNLAVPLDRYSKHLISMGINISTQCLSNYVIEAADILNPLYDKLKYELTHNKANVIHADETTIKVIDVSDRQKCYMFVYTTTFFDNPVYIYDFSETRKTTQTEELFKDYRGYLVCDQYKGYDKFKGKLAGIQRCMAHARRYFFDVVKALNPKEAKSSKAKIVVEKFDKLFSLEKQFKEKKYTISQIEQKRNTIEYKNNIESLHKEIWSINAQPGSLLEKAVNYCKNAWDELFTYLEYGYLEISNNLAERAVKPFVISRKNYLFSKTIDGAKASGLLFSIIQTAKANGLCVEKYLDYILTNINNMKIDDILPWSEKLPKNLKLNLK